MPSTPTRRSFLATLAGASAVGSAGCLDAARDAGVGYRPSNAQLAGDRSDWPSVRHNPSNTGFNPNTEGPSNPSIEWQTPIWASVTEAVVADGTVYLPMGDHLRAHDAATGEEHWRYSGREHSSFWQAPAVHDGEVYVTDEEPRVVALDPKTGAERWEAETDGDVRTPPTVATPFDDEVLVCVGTDNARLHAVSTRSETVVWTADTFTPASQAPAVSGQQLSVYVATHGGEVYGFDVEEGEPLWRTKLTTWAQSPPVLSARHLYISGFGDDLFALNPKRVGREEWDTEFGPGVGAVTSAGGSTFVASDGGLTALDTHDGSEWWHVPLTGRVTGAPAVSRDTVYVGDENGILHAVKRRAGLDAGPMRLESKRWTLDLGQPIRGRIAVADGTVYVPTSGNKNEDEDGHLYAIR
ncbi:PQQ-binding-like beta-propeller repeat protein [Halospeciosus flavus]|uniref:PQQ-binding-like beta-propeller repeat protein n=1 Tax=Halospeciosus flavus TaxID=3032283 RepID=A0ABD5Z6I9_9EURY|nr:PQQ-binding-like beta-propeller repeat protein [Halospeciosus flavus]